MPRAAANRSPKKGAAKKGGGKKKDPNAPKRPLSGYMFFVKSLRAAGKDKDKKVTVFISEAGAEWRTLKAADKTKFDKQAADDKKRYQKEMDAYTPDSD